MNEAKYLHINSIFSIYYKSSPKTVQINVTKSAKTNSNDACVIGMILYLSF